MLAWNPRSRTLACNCGKKKTGPAPTYVAKFSDGTSQTYKSEIEAKAAVARKGGTVKAQ